ncbi:hypothetical protein EZI54_22675 [Marinobacter halodurans]|uniref:Phage protein n=1 Tax=Marinobacter halodurans TaxID=2528979 RepID=A0ABY1ZHW4_9GAMM|nr:hypothetical protein [Marinobacter halodurans]TBW47493.1 hypothetical protein EZI54_22675 [Marinobacter halodurans]
MQIKIKNIERHLGEEKVEFYSCIGSGAGIWVGESPTLGQCIDIEFDIEDDFKWGENITTADNQKSMISVEKDCLRFVAQVVSYENDGCLTLKLGGTILFLDLDNAPMDLKGWIVGEAQSVKLYPTNL